MTPPDQTPDVAPDAAIGYHPSLTTVLPPNGCRHCGIGEREHAQRYTADAGWHTWQEPTDQQRLARMRARRDFLRDDRSKPRPGHPFDFDPVTTGNTSASHVGTRAATFTAGSGSVAYRAPATAARVGRVDAWKPTGHGEPIFTAGMLDVLRKTDGVLLAAMPGCVQPLTMADAVRLVDALGAQGVARSVGQCYHSAPTIPPFGDHVVCTLDFGHTGAHSDGSTTWSIPWTERPASEHPTGPASDDPCPWPIGTVLRSTGHAFTWIFERGPSGDWYEMGRAERVTWEYVSNSPNLVELVPRAPTLTNSAERGDGQRGPDAFDAVASAPWPPPSMLVPALDQILARDGLSPRERGAMEAITALAAATVGVSTPGEPAWMPLPPPLDPIALADLVLVVEAPVGLHGSKRVAVYRRADVEGARRG